MPRNRSDVASHEKREAIVLAARALFQRNGYDDTTMARIAREAGISSNTVYWYFQDKDALLVAVLDQLLSEGLADYQAQREKSVLPLLQWLHDQLAQNMRLISVVHARLEVSEALSAWHQGFHDLLEGEIKQRLVGQGVPARQTGAAATIVTFVLEGLLVHQPTPQRRNAVLRHLASSVKPTRS